MYSYLNNVLENHPANLDNMNDLKDKINGFERGLHIINNSINLSFQRSIKDAYKYISPIIDIDIYIKWLLQYAQDIGCKIVEEKIITNFIFN